jgi:hypothetical protein
MRNSVTIPIERNVIWQGEFETEPYEVAWASEAIFFIRTLSAAGLTLKPQAHVQISPDGMHWCDEGTSLIVSTEPGLTFGRVRHFGGWLRLRGELPVGSQVNLIVYLVLKE